MSSNVESTQAEQCTGTLKPKGTLPLHHATAINAISFSPEGSFVASCDEDGKLLVYHTDSRGVTSSLFRGYKASFELLSLVWHPVRPVSLITGSANGDVNGISFNKHNKANDDERLLYTFDGRVNVLAMTRNGETLAVACGNQVAVIRGDVFEKSAWDSLACLTFPVHEDGNSDVQGLHFMDDGTLIVLFYYQPPAIFAFSTTDPACQEAWRMLRKKESIIGGSALSPDGRLLAVTNLYDGIDWYSLEEEFRCLISTTTYPLGRPHYATNLAFLDDDTIAVGNGDGTVYTAKFSKSFYQCRIGLQIGGYAGKVFQNIAILRRANKPAFLVVSSMAHPPVPGRGPTNHLIVLLEVRHDHTVPQGDAPKKVIQQETNTARIQQNPEPRNELIQQNQEGGEAPIERIKADERQEEGVGSSTMQTMVFGLMTFAAVTGIAAKYLLPDPLNVSTLPATLSDLYPSVLIEMQNWGRDLGHVAGVGITGTTSHPPSTTTVTITEFLQATVTITAQPTENHSPASTCGVSFPTQLDQLE